GWRRNSRPSRTQRMRCGVRNPGAGRRHISSLLLLAALGAFVLLGAMSARTPAARAQEPATPSQTPTAPPADATPTVAPPSGGPSVLTATPTPLFGRPASPTPFVIPSSSVSPTPGEPDLPPAHLGYGVNIGPHSRVPY